jgi:16S rRNA (guanine527-N7)-methyltransferase
VSASGSSALADARAARVALDRLLETDAPFLIGSLPAGFVDAAEAYVALLLAANQRLNLTRVVEPDAVARLHLLDSLVALPLVDEVVPTSALDLGSGGGVPGIVLALARPDVRWTLVDSVGKKADAMRGFVDALRLPNVEVLAERAEVLGRGARRESYELVAARACAALPVLAEYALPLLRVGGTLLAWKGSPSAEELRSGASASALLGGGAPAVRPSNAPALGDHSFVVIDKLRPTPARYPRRPGEPARRPLD